MSKKLDPAKVKEAIKERLWEEFYKSQLEGLRTPCVIRLNASVTMLHRVLGTNDDNEAFKAKLLNLFPPPPPVEYVIALGAEDRRKVVDNLDGYCLPDEAKASIRKALGR